jgi:hypothetical protein
MRAIVMRNGALNGELFIECSHKPDGVHESPLRFSVPVQAELPIGTEVEITCEVVEIPRVEPEPPQGDVTAVTAEPPVVPTSPIVGEDAPPLIDTAPSGQTEAGGMPAVQEATNKAIEEQSDVQNEDNAAVS